MRALILAVSCSLALAGCGAQTTAENPIVSAGDTVTIRSAQALIVAHNAYQGAAAAAEVAVNSGRLTPVQLTQLKAINDRALALLEAADQGRDVAVNAARVMGTVTQINRLLAGGVE